MSRNSFLNTVSEVSKYADYRTEQLIHDGSDSFNFQTLPRDIVKILILYRLAPLLELDQCKELYDEFSHAVAERRQRRNGLKKLIDSQANQIYNLSFDFGDEPASGEISVLRQKATKILARATHAESEIEKLEAENRALRRAKGKRKIDSFDVAIPSPAQAKQAKVVSAAEREYREMLLEHQTRLLKIRQDNEGLARDVEMLEKQLGTLDTRIGFMAPGGKREPQKRVSLAERALVNAQKRGGKPVNLLEQPGKGQSETGHGEKPERPTQVAATKRRLANILAKKQEGVVQKEVIAPSKSLSGMGTLPQLEEIPGRYEHLVSQPGQKGLPALNKGKKGGAEARIGHSNSQDPEKRVMVLQQKGGKGPTGKNGAGKAAPPPVKEQEENDYYYDYDDDDDDEVARAPAKGKKGAAAAGSGPLAGKVGAGVSGAVARGVAGKGALGGSGDVNSVGVRRGRANQGSVEKQNTAQKGSKSAQATVKASNSSSVPKASSIRAKAPGPAAKGSASVSAKPGVAAGKGAAPKASASVGPSGGAKASAAGVNARVARERAAGGAQGAKSVRGPGASAAAQVAAGRQASKSVRPKETVPPEGVNSPGKASAARRMKISASVGAKPGEPSRKAENSKRVGNNGQRESESSIGQRSSPARGSKSPLRKDQATGRDRPISSYSSESEAYDSYEENTETYGSDVEEDTEASKSQSALEQCQVIAPKERVARPFRERQIAGSYIAAGSSMSASETPSEPSSGAPGRSSRARGAAAKRAAAKNNNDSRSENPEMSNAANGRAKAVSAKRNVGKNETESPAGAQKAGSAQGVVARRAVAKNVNGPQSESPQRRANAAKVAAAKNRSLSESADEPQGPARARGKMAPKQSPEKAQKSQSESTDQPQGARARGKLDKKPSSQNAKNSEADKPHAAKGPGRAVKKPSSQDDLSELQKPPKARGQPVQKAASKKANNSESELNEESRKQLQARDRKLSPSPEEQPAFSDDDADSEPQSQQQESPDYDSSSHSSQVKNSGPIYTTPGTNYKRPYVEMPFDRMVISQKEQEEEETPKSTKSEPGTKPPKPVQKPKEPNFLTARDAADEVVQMIHEFHDVLRRFRDKSTVC